MKLKQQLFSLVAVFFILFNVLAFVIPFVHTPAFFIAYGATFLFFLFFAACVFAFTKARQKPFGLILRYPLLQAAWIALVLQLACCFLLMGLSQHIAPWICVIIEAILLAGTIAALIIKDTAKEIVSATEEKLASQTKGVKAMRALCVTLPGLTDNSSLKARLQKLCEDLHCADPMVQAADEQLEEALMGIQAALQNKDEADAMQCLSSAEKFFQFRRESIKLSK